MRKQFLYYLYGSIFILFQQNFAQNVTKYDWMYEGLIFGQADFLNNVVLNIDSNGNLISAGSYSMFTDFFYIHKNSGSFGELIWKLDSRFPPKHEGNMLDIMVDEKNNIYIAGYYFTVSPITDNDTLFVKKVTTINGITQIAWEYVHLIGDDYLNIINREFKLTNHDSSIFVTGITLNRKPLADIVTIKLDKNGNEIWKNNFTNGENYDVSPKDIGVDINRNIFVLGNSVKDDSSSVQLVKYNTKGELLWNKTIVTPNNPKISAIDLEISNGTTWISANSSGETFLLNIDSIGNVVNEIIRETSGSNLGLSIDESRNVYQINDDSVLKYDSTGNLVSSVELPSLSNVEYSFFTVDEEQNIYIVGQRTHFYTVKLNENLEFVSAFETNWKEPPNKHYDSSVSYGITASSEFGLFISGELSIYDSLNFNSYNEQISVKYSQLPTDVEEIYGIPSNYSLSQNYPNPFNPTTIIKYTIPNVGNENFRSVQLKVYDVLGKEVATLINKAQQAGNYEVEFNAKNLSSGIYFYKLQSGSFVETKKMLLLR